MEARSNTDEEEEEEEEEGTTQEPSHFGLGFWMGPGDPGTISFWPRFLDGTWGTTQEPPCIHLIVIIIPTNQMHQQDRAHTLTVAID